MPLQPSSLTLSCHPASTTISLVRIAAALKSVPLTFVDQNFDDPEVLPRKKPTASLIVTYPSTEQLIIKQPLVMLEFIDEAYTGPLQLIPPITDIRKRYCTRDLAALVQCEIQPLRKNKVRHMVWLVGGDVKLWGRNLQINGLRSYESRVRHSMGRFSVGDEPSLADVCLYPMVQRARELGVNMEKMGLKLVPKIIKECEKLDAFRNEFVQSEKARPTQAGEEDQSDEVGELEASDDQAQDEASKEESFPLSRTVPL